MLLKGPELTARMEGEEPELLVVPRPDLVELRENGSASIDLRLGRWFRTMRQSRLSLLPSVAEESGLGQEQGNITKEYYVPFGDQFVLHPGKFLLGITLEWIRLPVSLAGYVTGKSSLGRRGLIIETAAGIHPGFTGCLTLELTNLGEIPIGLVPGMQICQVFLHEVSGEGDSAKSRFLGRRKSTVGRTVRDPVLEKLKRTT